MVAELVGMAQNWLGYTVPYFLLVFGIIYLALAFVLRPLAQLLAMPVAVFAIAISISWFAISGNGLLALQPQIMEVIGLGLVFMVLGKVFAGG